MVGGQGSGVPPEVTNQSDVVRGVSHAGQSLVGGDLLEAGQRDHLLHLHTHHMCVTSVIHTKNTWLHFCLIVIFKKITNLHWVCFLFLIFDLVKIWEICHSSPVLQTLFWFTSNLASGSLKISIIKKPDFIWLSGTHSLAKRCSK